MNGIIDLVIKWTGPALEQVTRLGVNAKEELENRVREHAKTTVPQATTARIRCVHIWELSLLTPTHSFISVVTGKLITTVVPIPTSANI